MGSDWVISAPLTVNWALNTTCNFSCRHCYSRNDPTTQLDGAVLGACFGKVARAGVLAVNFGGGEPLLRPDLAELAATATSLGLRVSMNSNGYLLDAAMARVLAEAGFAGVGISIDSHLPEVHDSFRGMPGSHVRACRAVGHLRDAGIATSLSTVICAINHRHLDELVRFALEVGVRRVNFHNFKCAGSGLTSRDELDLSPGQWQEFYRRAQAAAALHPDLAISFDDPIIASLGTRSAGLVKGSVCGKLSLNIKANGDITPCGFIPDVLGNIVTDDLKGLWHGHQLLHALRHKEPRGKCGSCDHYSECLGGCSARALATTGDANSPDPHCWVNP